MTKFKLPYAEVYPTAAHIVEVLRPFCDRIEIAGSLRREKPLIGDIEIVARPKRRKNLFGQELTGEMTALDEFLDSKNVQFTKRGPLYQQFAYGEQTVDLFLPTADTWGCIFAIRTGDADFSRWLVTSQAAGGAMPAGVTFWQGRMFYNSHVLLTPEEEDVFKVIGAKFIPPKERNGWPVRWEKTEPEFHHPPQKAKVW